jgi:hypothetical protein
MSLTIAGTIFKILPEISGEGRNGPWKKKEFVIETADEFPRKICFGLWNDKIALLNDVTEGDGVNVSFNASSREYNERWFTDLKAWKVEKVDGQAGAPEPPPITENEVPPEVEGKEDIPF